MVVYELYHCTESTSTSVRISVKPNVLSILRGLKGFAVPNGEITSAFLVCKSNPEVLDG